VMGKSRKTPLATNKVPKENSLVSVEGSSGGGSELSCKSLQAHLEGHSTASSKQGLNNYSASQ
jgi:hypothetical protein